jgi:hypothetical protein
VPRLSWNEIESRAIEFAAKWQGETYEKGESQSFWGDFLNVYGIDRRRHGAFFEYAIKKTGGKQGFIDLFWPGYFLAEQKSAGRDLIKATGQAYDYLPAMPDHDLPQAIVVCDFAEFQVRILETNQTASFTLDQFPRHVRIFGFLIDDSSKFLADEDPVNRKAAEGMARLHNQLEENRYRGRDLELLLVRLVFCLFADDAHIFERNSFANFLRNRTRDDGSDLGPLLVRLFDVLNTPLEDRQTNLDADLMAFPYINGGLFEQPIRTPDFNSEMRRSLLTAVLLDWAKVSPAIFGSMFQGVMDEKERRNLGAHYTSEKNILRVIQPLFLDDLYAEFERVRHSRSQLERFHTKLGTLNFLDPACGCGNFLVITYRELRKLEHRVVLELTKGQQVLDVRSMLHVDVNQMHGIEIEEFPSLIAQTALWLTDHQMNLEASKLLGQHYVRLPLTASANIVHANALTTDWRTVVPPEELNYILGNPPFIGSKLMTAANRSELLALFPNLNSAGNLDFVSAWYAKSVEIMKANPKIQTALVSTNSITQGEQVALLWRQLVNDGVLINFAHRTFKWTNDASGVAAVFCVIVGFALERRRYRRIFDYPDIRGEPLEVAASNINPYLVDAPTMFIGSRSRPLSSVPEMSFGNMPNDGGHLFVSKEEVDSLEVVVRETLIRRFVGAYEFINGKERYCLWMDDAPLSLLRTSNFVRERIEATRTYRMNSVRAATRKLADSPNRFGEIRQPSAGNYIVVPRHSSESRSYIPLGLLGHEVIVGDSCLFIPDATIFDLGILTSNMHMAWVRAVCGRLKSDYRYSKDIVYNNFPWPETTDDQKQRLGELAQGILDARANHPESNLADLYDPLTMPSDLRKAHDAVDRYVDRLYRKQPFDSDADRVAHLFTLYQKLTTS